MPTDSAPILREVSLTRLHVLRATYLLIVIGGGIMFLPQLIRHEPMTRGVIPSLLAGMWLLACFGLRYPLQMLPVLLFELAWKTIWLVDYGLPQWMAGAGTAQFRSAQGHGPAAREVPSDRLPALPPQAFSDRTR